MTPRFVEIAEGNLLAVFPAVLVVQQNRIDRATVKRALAALRKATPNVVGVVLNAVDVKGKGYYGYAYYGPGQEATTGAPPPPEAAVRDATTV